MEVFKPGIKSHLRSAEPIILGLVFCSCFPGVLAWLDMGKMESNVWLAIIVFMVTGFPSVFIYLSYYFANRNMEFAYEHGSQEITILKGSTVTVFKLDDIERLVRSISFNLAANRSGFLPWDMFNHSFIFLKDGQRFVITSLLVPNLTLPIDAERIEVKENVFRMVLK